MATPPAIVSQPTPFFGNCGDTATYTIAATGTAPLYYQWRWNGLNLINSGRVSSATSPTLVITNLQSTDTGNISVAVSNTAGWAISGSVALYVRDTLDYTISWPSGDLDIGVWEPDGETFYAGDYWYSDNGAFSADCLNGGTEWWVMYDVHQTGPYNLKIRDWDYTGDVWITVYHNEMMVSAQTMSYYVEAENIYTFDTITVVRSGGKDVLKFNVTKEPIPPGAVKPEPKGPSPRPFGQ